MSKIIEILKAINVCRSFQIQNVFAIDYFADKISIIYWQYNNHVLKYKYCVTMSSLSNNIYWYSRTFIIRITSEKAHSLLLALMGYLLPSIQCNILE